MRRRLPSTIASRGVGGMNGRSSAGARTVGGKIAGRALESRAKDLRLRSSFSVCQSDMRLCPPQWIVPPRRKTLVHDGFDFDTARKRSCSRPSAVVRSQRIALTGWSSVPAKGPNCRSSATPTCSDIRQATSSLATVTIRGQSRTTWVTAIFDTPCASAIFGATENRGGAPVSSAVMPHRA
jgi:hypothetical protein